MDITDQLTGHATSYRELAISILESDEADDAYHELREQAAQLSGEILAWYLRLQLPETREPELDRALVLFRRIADSLILLAGPDHPDRIDVELLLGPDEAQALADGRPTLSS